METRRNWAGAEAKGTGTGLGVFIFSKFRFIKDALNYVLFDIYNEHPEEVWKTRHLWVICEVKAHVKTAFFSAEDMMAQLMDSEDGYLDKRSRYASY